ncbi:MAG: DciA family protein [Filomicrobium sp.]
MTQRTTAMLPRDRTRAAGNSGARQALASQASRARKPLNIGKSVGSFVPQLAQKAFEKYGFSTVALLTDWAVIVGKDLACFTRPERLKWPRQVAVSGDVEAGCEGRPGATLVLRVAPARALEVQYGTRQIVDRINSYFGYSAVADVRILQAPLGDEAALQAPEHAVASGSEPKARQSGVSEGATLSDDMLKGVANEKLRASLKKLQAEVIGGNR